VGGPAGLLFAWTSISYFGQAGIDLGNAAYGDFGFSNLIFPALEPVEYLKVTIMVFAMALLASLFPARKALSLNPADAIRK
jgi:ABC-type lipoprotein release transport system permease subunit